MHKIYGLYGASANGVRGKDFSTHINNGRGTSFRKHVWGKYFFVHLYALFFTLDTICADNKDKPMAGCKNQLIKVTGDSFIIHKFEYY